MPLRVTHGLSPTVNIGVRWSPNGVNNNDEAATQPDTAKMLDEALFKAYLDQTWALFAISIADTLTRKIK